LKINSAEPSYGDHLSINLVALFRKIFNVDPILRPTAADFYSDSWMLGTTGSVDSYSRIRSLSSKPNSTMKIQSPGRVG
jgi:hypothetical protein